MDAAAESRGVAHGIHAFLDAHGLDCAAGRDLDRAHRHLPIAPVAPRVKAQLVRARAISVDRADAEGQRAQLVRARATGEQDEESAGHGHDVLQSTFTDRVNQLGR